MEISNEFAKKKLLKWLSHCRSQVKLKIKQEWEAAERRRIAEEERLRELERLRLLEEARVREEQRRLEELRRLEEERKQEEERQLLLQLLREKEEAERKR